MFDVTSETRDDTSVSILKSRLTLLVILSARSSKGDTFTDWRQRPYYKSPIYGSNGFT